MFTGIVETIGTVRARRQDEVVIEPENRWTGVRPGESISVNGVCLTVDRAGGREFSFRLLPETIRVSTLGLLKPGARVNLERSLRAGSRLGGHLLLGHVDGRGRILSRVEKGGSVTLEVQIPPGLVSGLVPKGPIAIDGVSLTLDSRIERGRARVHLVSHTLGRTTLGRKKKGDRVNLELDLIVKYLRGVL